MSKKIKGVGFDSYEDVEHGDNRTRFKHQKHVQDYIELQKVLKAKAQVPFKEQVKDSTRTRHHKTTVC